MAFEYVPLTLPASADPSFFATFGKEVKGVTDPGNLTSEQFNELQDALYKVRSAIVIAFILETYAYRHPTMYSTVFCSFAT